MKRLLRIGWRKNKACSSKMNFMQDENCKTSFQEAVNLAGVLVCFGVESISKELGNTLKKMAAGFGLVVVSKLLI